ncbi:MAG: HNH endonuclease signature motif containing protein [Candidatus Eremiobacteraeota bacterium]|nr:HNH endonuclease signature motif containing protein [Candidatus Eremiobacteraeota bacterium]
MDTFETHTTHSLFLPDEEELLYLAEPCCLKDHEDMLLLPEPYELPGEIIYKPEHMVKITWEGLIPEAEKLTEDITFGSIVNDERASQIDFTLCEAVRGRLALDLTIGAFLVNLKTKGVDHLGYRSMVSFAVEHLSMSGRTASELMRNFEFLKVLPLTREAYLQGRIARSALRHLLRVITPENEAEWLGIAQKLSVSGLEREVKKVLAAGESARKQSSCVRDSQGLEQHSQGAQAPGSHDNELTHKAWTSAGATDSGSSEESDGMMMHFRVAPALALTWDFALSFFRDKEHYDGPLAGFVEALLANFLASRKPAPAPLDDRGSLPLFYRAPFMTREQRARPIGDQEAVQEKGSDGKGGTDDPWESPWDIFFPSWLDGEADGEPVRALAARLIKAAAIRQRLDVATGMLLRAMQVRSLFTGFGYESVEEYAQERCGFSKAQARQLITLANGFRRHSLTEKAFRSGTITREQARLILPLVNSKNEEAWIAYAAGVPTIDLREEVERIARIIEYDSFVPINYTLLPGFRYITDERYHELSFEVRDIIRTGSWYGGPSPVSAWPLSEDDEAFLEARDRRFDEPWKHFNDVDEFLACEAAMKIEKNSVLCAGEAALEKAREICTMPQGASPEETFLMDILSVKDPSQAATGSMTIKFFLPAELYDLWNTTATAFLLLTAQAESTQAEGVRPDSSHPSYAPVLPEEKFLAALLADYLAPEGKFHKATHHHKILRRDRFRCQAPGCRCRRNLHVHHIIRRSQGGTDDPWNLITLCEACHLHLLHGLGTLTVKGKAHRDLTFIFGSLSEGGPFLVYEKGVKSPAVP